MKPNSAILYLTIAISFLFQSQAETLPPLNLSATNEVARQRIFDWNQETLERAYDKFGKHSPRWDSQARAALRSLARQRAGLGGPADELCIRTNCASAVAAGCDDPLVKYFFVCAVLSHQERPQSEQDQAIHETAIALEASSYPPIRKFYAALSDPKSTSPPKEGHGVLIQLTPTGISQESSDEVFQGPKVGYQRAIKIIKEVLSDKSIPPQEAFAACGCLFEPLKSHQAVKQGFPTIGLASVNFPLIERLLTENQPPYLLQLIKGYYYMESAWEKRGTRFADTVTASEWQGFSNNLAMAEQSLEAAWKLNPNDPSIALTMMGVELGQGKGKERMELWFERVLALDPNNYSACLQKLYYLEPKWYGSPDEMLAFGRQCAKSQTSTGQLPIILVDAHIALASYLDETKRLEYWKQPPVWQDVSAAYARYLSEYPEDFTRRQRYAYRAYLARQWDVLNQQIPLLGEIDYSIFGGRANFNQMIALAQRNNSATGNK